MTKTENKQKKKQHKAPVIILCVLAALYFAGVVLFSSLAFPRTSVNADSRSWQKLDTLLDKKPDDHKVVFQGRDGIQLALSQEDIEVYFNRTEADSVEQNPWAWPVEIFKEHPYKASYQMNYNPELLEKKIQESDFPLNGKEPEDAHLLIDEKGVQIVKEDEGNKVDAKALQELILKSLQEGKEKVDTEEVYLHPKKRSDDPDLLKEKEKWDRTLAASVTFDFGDRKFTFGQKELLKAVTKDKNGDYILDPKAVNNWVANVAYQTDTRAKDHTFQATGVGQVTVKGGYYGWWTDVAKTTAKVQEALDKGGDQVITPVYKQTARSRSKNDIGNTYVEIDLSRQHAWFYKNGQLLVESDVVTGWVNKGRMTPTGVEMVLYKERNATLRGQLWNGTPYASPVKYWMPVDGLGDGMHDSSWRKQFGGEIYIHQGSNGCINFPYENVQKIYNNIEAGTPVIIYESTTNYSSSRSNGLR